MAAKKPRTSRMAMSDDHRLKIKNSNILNVLIEHVQGTREMSATQVSAGIALLRKVLPDLSSVEQSGEVQVSYVARMPAPPADMNEWQQRYAPPSIQ